MAMERVSIAVNLGPEIPASAAGYEAFKEKFGELGEHMHSFSSHSSGQMRHYHLEFCVGGEHAAEVLAAINNEPGYVAKLHFRE
jgi:hypothetical protein